MSAFSYEQVDGFEIPEDIRGEIVEQTIETLRAVAENVPNVNYAVLPVQSDAFEIADLVTNKMCHVEDRGTYFSGMHIERANFHDVPLEFATQYSRMEREDEQEVVIAWGVRRLAETMAAIPPRNVKLPSSIFDKALLDIEKLQEPDRKQLPRAA